MDERQRHRKLRTFTIGAAEGEGEHTAAAAAAAAAAASDEAMPPGSSKAVLDRPRLLSADLGGPLPEGLVDGSAAVESPHGLVIGERDSHGVGGGSDAHAATGGGESGGEGAPNAAADREARRAARLERLAERTGGEPTTPTDDAAAAEEGHDHFTSSSDHSHPMASSGGVGVPQSE